MIRKTKIVVKTEIDEISITIDSQAISGDALLAKLEAIFYAVMGWKPEGRLDWVDEEGG